MSQTLSPIVTQNNVAASPNTFSILSSMTPSVTTSSIQPVTTVSLGATPFSSASRTGLVSSTTPIVNTSSPVVTQQTVNSPVIPIQNIPLPVARSSPNVTLQGNTVPMSTTTNIAPQSLASGTISGIPVQINLSQPQGALTPSRMVSQTNALSQIGPVQAQSALTPSRMVSQTNGLSQIGIVQPQSALTPSRMISQTNVSNQILPRMSSNIVQPAQSPNARSALLNLSGGTMSSAPTVTIPTVTQISGNRAMGTGQGSALLPFIKVATPNSSLPFRPTAQIMNQEFEVRNYQGIIANSSLENELLNAGYAPLSKIVIRTDSGDKRTQYIKAINKKGQKVFILIDVNGYTTARSTDLTLIEAHSASIVPYSLKTGAYECAGKDVCGVAFECGSDSVCVLSRGAQDLSPKEANFVFVEQPAPAAATLETEGSIMTYPVIRLTEIRANPALVLANTDIVTRRLRNSTYSAELQELAAAQQSINKLNAAFIRFNHLREDAASKLNRTLTQLEQWNDVYMANPPTTDEAKDRYRRLQYNLAQRNDGIATLLRSMKKVSDKRLEIDVITKEINDITDYAEKEFANVEFATSD